MGQRSGFVQFGRVGHASHVWHSLLPYLALAAYRKILGEQL